MIIANYISGGVLLGTENITIELYVKRGRLVRQHLTIMII